MISAGWNDVSGLPTVELAVFIPGLTLAAGLIKFVVDTGSVATTVHGFDAHWRLGIAPSSLDPRMWADLRMMSGIGGVVPYSEFDAVFGFYHVDGHLDVIEGRVQLGEWQSEEYIPSLLGWDLLRRFELHSVGDQSMTLEPL